MATSNARAKGKLKKSAGRLAKMKLGNKEACSADTSDLSQLRKPIDTSISNLRQIAQLFEKGSDEVRDILTYECDIVYECKICRSLFRSFANLISHKRIYCPEKYGINSPRYSTDSPDDVYNKNNNSEKRTPLDFDYKENYSNDRILRSQATRKEPRKDLTSVVDMLIKKQNNDVRCNDVYSPKSLRITNDNEQVLLQMMDSNQAAYQTVISSPISPTSNNDLMKAQTEELRNMSNRTTAVLGPDGQFHEVYLDVRKTSDERMDDHFDFDANALNPTSSEDFTCTTCNTKFATKKTLTFHVKYKHASHRTGFPCPCCSSTFANRWSVYRHLYKVHRKSNEQVRRLRPQIQARALRRDPSRLRKIFKSSETTDKATAQETQNLATAREWMKNLELDGDLQHKCVACGKRFDRKAALVSHSLICKERVNSTSPRNGFANGRRHKRASKNPPQRVETINQSDNSTLDDETTSSTSHSESTMSTSPPSSSNLFAKDAKSLKAPEPRPRSPSIISTSAKEQTPEIAIRVEDVSSLSKDVWDMIGSNDDDFRSSNCNGETLVSPKTPETSISSGEQPTRIPSEESCPETTRSCDEKALGKTSLKNVSNADVPEVIYTSIDNSRPVALSVLETEKKLGIQYRGIRLPTVTLEKIDMKRRTAASREPTVSLDVTSVNFKDKTIASSLANLRKLQCLPCNRKFVSLLNLKRHIAVHRRRSRYRCKLCDFQASLKCDFIAHCNKKHDAKNNRKTLSELIIEMPVNDCSSSNEADARLPNDLEVIDVTHRKNCPSAKIAQRKTQVNEGKASEPSAAVPVAAAERPRRSRPRKRKGQKKKFTYVKRSTRRLRHVSPPALNKDEPTAELEVIGKIDAEAARVPRAPSRMSCNPELRKMVMEVIFGPAEKPNDENTEMSNEISTDDVTIEKFEAETSSYSQTVDSRASGAENVEKPNAAPARSKIQSWKSETSEPANNNVTFDENKSASFPEDVSIADESCGKPIILRRKISTNGTFVKLKNSDVPQRNFLLTSPLPQEAVRAIIFDGNNVSDAKTANILNPADR